ncbi:MBL fold metallo-hydrolase [Actinoplanes teichomyceticus]|uniref:L-ascorbate metabolism protein UlaG (Beta-lactamase superfamily) n=1 Tax=Actinoplanes teichomyceticus TaxID=1867 RepID=Q6ZZG8_ACTTI|nr:MBL fold metallo-hydrolase [Actinoplanes teichomyceticus]TWG09453.1 L-ascorbate metabolism protein UlaG (beta-lactamase superfamily) [Actinoplanes teichomyceticus]GIF17142.1 hypothetical protein Ate01nite_71740 [Actinoplanes teichomyceticus]CAG15037.1 nonheme iron dioxygenase [Actinoplanes teichomyceticus]
MGVNEPVRLRSNAIIEPLVDRFYAWLHTVAPVPAALHLADFQVPLLESYLRDPRARAAAGAGPAPTGGHLAELDETGGMEIAALLDGIKRDRADMLGLAAAVTEAEDLLQRYGRTPPHPGLPAALHGLVQPVSGPGRQPAIRVLESLAYDSRYYDERRQSVRLSLDDGAERPGILGTPRLPRPGALDLAVPFRHAGLDELFAARLRPTTLSRLREALELDDTRAGRLRALLTTEPGTAPERHLDAGGRIRFFGHACLLFQTPEAAVITDPFISADNRHGDRYTFDDLPDHIDLAVITQGRPDHVVLETLLQLRSRIGAMVVPRSSRGNLHDPSIGRCLRALGFPVIEVDDFDEVPFPGGRVVAAPFLDEHGEPDVRAKSTYLVQLAGASVFVGADSSGVDPVAYRLMRRQLGRVDLAFLGMRRDNAPPARPAGQTRGRSGCDARQAAAIMQELGADEGYVYVMGEQPWQRHVMAAAGHRDPGRRTQIDEFLGWCRERGITAERLLHRREWRW